MQKSSHTQVWELFCLPVQISRGNAIALDVVELARSTTVTFHVNTDDFAPAVRTIAVFYMPKAEGHVITRNLEDEVVIIVTATGQATREVLSDLRCTETSEHSFHKIPPTLYGGRLGKH